jgi:uncharacterized protein
MKILAVTDIHGAYSLVGRMISDEMPDVVVVGGDITTGGSVNEAEDAVRKFSKQCSRVVCVSGNMDSPAHDELFERLGVSINGRAEVIDKVGFFGVSAAPRSPLHTPYEISEEEILARALVGFSDLGDRELVATIFVPHAPPHGTTLDVIRSGAHVGSTAIREFIDENHPTVVICGHIHEARGEDVLGVTRMINCGAASKGYYAIIQAGGELSILPKQYEMT